MLRVLPGTLQAAVSRGGVCIPHGERRKYENLYMYSSLREQTRLTPDLYETGTRIMYLLHWTGSRGGYGLKTLAQWKWVLWKTDHWEAGGLQTLETPGPEDTAPSGPLLCQALRPHLWWGYASCAHPVFPISGPWPCVENNLLSPVILED